MEKKSQDAPPSLSSSFNGGISGGDLESRSNSSQNNLSFPAKK